MKNTGGFPLLPVVWNHFKTKQWPSTPANASLVFLQSDPLPMNITAFPECFLCAISQFLSFPQLRTGTIQMVQMIRACQPHHSDANSNGLISVQEKEKQDKVKAGSGVVDILLKTQEKTGPSP